MTSSEEPLIRDWDRHLRGDQWRGKRKRRTFRGVRRKCGVRVHGNTNTHLCAPPNMSAMAVEMDSSDTTRYRRLEAVVSLLCSHHVMPQCAPVRILLIIMVVFFPRRHCGWCGVVWFRSVAMSDDQSWRLNDPCDKTFELT